MPNIDIKNEISSFSELFDKNITPYVPGNPELLYQPITYISSLPSKKLRPFLLYLFYRAYGNGKEFDQNFWNICVSIEMMHNFTLIHDDIMDEDDWRRGKETVHKKWDINTAILGGDGLLALAFKVLSEHKGPYYREIMQEFSRAVLTVCEGQALDKVFEKREAVSETDYLEMIYKKTASLIESASVIGAYSGEAPVSDIDFIRQFGKNLGLAFQLQDDFLDIFGNQDELGKDIGSDILLHKKTLIMIEIMKNDAVLQEVDRLTNETKIPIDKIKSILSESGIAAKVTGIVTDYTGNAKKILEKLQINNDVREHLWALADYLEKRSH